MNALPENTERLLHELDAEPLCDEFILAGGTALALRLAHRSSEDLDFVFPAERLPKIRIEKILRNLEARYAVKPMVNTAEQQDWENAGMDLLDYHRDYSVDNVKVTFFTPDERKLAAALRAESGIYGLTRIRVADLDTLFAMKAVTLNRRLVERDLFDLKLLIEEHGYSMEAILRLADEHGYTADGVKQRIINARRRLDDPGLKPRMANPPTFDQLKAYFVNQIDRAEQAAAEAAFSTPAPGKD